MSEQPAPQRTAVIIGAGPAGLTAAFEFLKSTKVIPIILERSDEIGGIARTINHNGNRIDIGGHRFFSKSDRVMNWWLDMMPLQSIADKEAVISYWKSSRNVSGNGAGPDPDKEERVMLLRNRKSRIYFMRKFFDYPISFSPTTLKNMGLRKTMKVGMSYMKASAFQTRPEKTLDQFLINRFGRELYLTFFKDYTEKVWGVPCSEISAAWGAQRIKGLSLYRALKHFMTKALSATDIGQKTVETSLIERFLYPKLGPGQMWEYVAKDVQKMGGEILMNLNVEKVRIKDNNVESIDVRDSTTNEVKTFRGDYFFSTMAIKDLIRAMDPPAPAAMREISEGLTYRDFVTVGLLVKKLQLKPDRTDLSSKLISDNWIYIQEPDVKLGRLQIFNNWSPYMVADPNLVWMGLEYFCDEGDFVWNKSKEEMVAFACKELEQIGIIDAKDVVDATVIKVEKTYPGYFGTYDRFEELRAYLDSIQNLFLVGRNGMHKYNNQDHSMLTAMTAVENIANGISSKENLWSINMEADYHEEKSAKS